jgi:glutamate synthase (NADPH/NADH) large chain
MMRVCHLDTCPVGVATQNPELRKRFSGKPEFVVNFFEFIAQEVREHLAALGFRSIAEAVGHAEVLDMHAAVKHWKASGLDLSPILKVADNPYPGQNLLCTRNQNHHLDRALDQELIKQSEMAIEVGWRVNIDLPIHNVNRSVGTMLGSEVTRRWGGEGLPDDTIQIHLRGSAGQSFGAFVPRGITLHLEGDANDYTAKGLSGGRIIVNPDRDAVFDAEDNIIAGNVVLYGATSGEAFIRGLVGERFAVRNSGAIAVVEGVGDHGCEYMTGGRVVVLGPTGRNFAAGMSGGIAYVYDSEGDFGEHVNREMVDLEPLDRDDCDWLFDIIARHRDLTGSPRADAILSDWFVATRRMVKVMPRDYKRVMSVMRLAEVDGMSIDEAHDRVMVAAHG